MKTAVLHGPRDFRVEDVDDPKPSPDGAVVQVKAFGICGSELPLYTSGFQVPGRSQSHVLKERSAVDASMAMTGHEFSGVVAEVGANVT